jgi:hypothetical protein
MWQFKKIDGRGKFVAVSGRKVARKGPKRLKSGRRKLFFKSLVKLIENVIQRCQMFIVAAIFLRCCLFLKLKWP